jgi:hypothetical protein
MIGREVHVWIGLPINDNHENQKLINFNSCHTDV